ncbi:MAG: gamma carbonic anhydrase family protein [Thiobacillaceae bacterium]|jgi:carbonic anhydrase/acetyltransferase-like protein (isoleucine patch superfamily)|nr:gamma carbonic anhydrase family protein [Thiobacillaceae bacterium]
MAIEAFQGRLPEIGRGVFVHPSATVIGDVALGEEVSVWPGAVIRGDVNAIRVGAGSNVQDNSVLHVSHKRPEAPEGAPLIIGERVTVGHGVILHGCTVEDECLIGMGSLVMDHAVIEPRVLLAAGSLVPEGRVLRGGWLHLGRPARPLRPLSAEELAWFAYQADNYRRLAAQYR